MLGAIGVIWMLASAVVVSALSGIYRTALYHYAANGQVPGEFAGIDFGAAFRPDASAGTAAGSAFGSPSATRCARPDAIGGAVIEIDTLPQLRDPVLVVALAGWVDAGLAGSGSVAVLQEQLESRAEFGASTSPT